MAKRCLHVVGRVLQEYVQSEENETDEAISADDLLWLENLANHPMQINRVDRSDLQQLPFLSEQQIDSLLVYRQQRKGLLSLGELQFITGFDYFTRRYLSLFVRCDSLMLSTAIRLPTPNPHTLKQLLTLGKHEIESRVDLPLYRRKGYCTPDKPTPTNYYVGNPLHHVVRYRYQYKREIAYGLTTDKDAGEPVAKQGFYPYDYWSAYFMLRPKHRPWSFVLGDYEVRGNRGLLLAVCFMAVANRFSTKDVATPLVSVPTPQPTKVASFGVQPQPVSSRHSISWPLPPTANSMPAIMIQATPCAAFCKPVPIAHFPK